MEIYHTKVLMDGNRVEDRGWRTEDSGRHPKGRGWRRHVEVGGSGVRPSLESHQPRCRMHRPCLAWALSLIRPASQVMSKCRARYRASAVKI